MIRACSKDGKNYIASNDLEEKKSFYICPSCNEYVFLKKHNENPQFLHYDGFSSHEWESNSLSHCFMVKNVYEYFRKFKWIKSININESVDINDTELIPDIYIITNTNNKIAIECQLTNYSRDVLFEKTGRYSHMGIYCLWIFHDSLLKLLNRNENYFYNVYNKIGAGSGVVKNIVVNRFYIFNSKSRSFIDTKSIEPLYVSNIEEIDNMLNLNHDFDMDNDVIDKKKKKDIDILGGYPSLFAFDRCGFIGNDKKYTFLKTMYNKIVSFDDFDMIILSNTTYYEKNMKFLFDYNFPSADNIFVKLSYKYTADSITSLFNDVERVW